MARSYPTSLDVAKLAGVSQITVSRAFSGKTFVSEKMRQRVEKAAAQLGYRPNLLASGLRGGRTRTIAAIWPFGSFYNDQQVPLQLMEQGRKRGHATFISNLLGSRSDLMNLLNEYLNRHVDGLLVLCAARLHNDSQLHQCLEQFPATVVVTAQKIENLKTDQLVHDRLEAIRQAVRYLAATGKRRLSIVASIDSVGDQWKINAFRETCDQCELSSHPRSVIDFNMRGQNQKKVLSQAMIERLQQTFKSKVDIDAILCLSDEGAMAAIRFFESRHLRVPEDVAVIGFNNIEAGRLWNPALATVDRQFDKVAQVAQQMLFDRMEQQARVPKNRDNSLDMPNLLPRCRHVAMQFVWRPSAGLRVPSNGQEQEAYREGESGSDSASFT